MARAHETDDSYNRPGSPYYQELSPEVVSLAKAVGLLPLPRPAPKHIKVTIHEAGHAVVALHSRIPFDVVVLFTPHLAGTSIHLDTVLRGGASQRARVRKMILVLFAGPATSVQLGGPPAEWGQDLQTAVNVAGIVAPRFDAAELPGLYQKAVAAVSRRATEILNVATALEQRLRLSHRDVKDICGVK